jgi:hypothetical protein
MSIVTIIDEPRIQIDFLCVASIFNIHIFGNKFDNGRIYITKITAYQLKLSINAEILHQIGNQDL